MCRHILALVALMAVFSGCKTQRALGRLELDEQALRRHVEILAHDSLGGRLTGTPFERKAADYIAEKMNHAGLLPLHAYTGYLQPFAFIGGATANPANNSISIFDGSTVLAASGPPVRTGPNTYPLLYSATGQAKGTLVDVGHGLKAPDGSIDEISRHLDDTGKIVLVNLAWPDTLNPHLGWAMSDGWRTRLQNVRALKPKAVIFYNSDRNLGPGSLRSHRGLEKDSLVLYHVSDSLAKVLKNLRKDEIGRTVQGQRFLVPGAVVAIRADVELHEKTAFNVLGYLDKGKRGIIVIGAHYDHLGHGEFGNSLSTEHDIHNGADDNASGVAVMLELARRMENDTNLPYNVLFAAFSGEELGLLGSTHLTRNFPFDTARLVFMVNMDMVGRLSSQKDTAIVYGVGTSPSWPQRLDAASAKGPALRRQPEGQGPSDHTSFYMMNKPVLHFFTGAHSDYHKPSDVADKIDYKGMNAVGSLIYRVVSTMPDTARLAFTPTKPAMSASPAFRVTLGIMPDYFWEGQGLRVTAVSPGKPAEKAGVQPGDVIVRMGDYPILDINDYMSALGRYKKGDKVIVGLRRGDKAIEVEATF